MQEKFLKEDLLQYLWNTGDFDVVNLSTTTGEPIQIISRGVLNNDAGPDFLDAKIKIGTTLWAGNVEIHKYSSDWNKHQHHKDQAYENVILHVVFKDDDPVNYSNEKRIPCLTLQERIRPQSTKNYHQLLYNSNWIPCQYFFPKVNQFKKKFWYEKLLVERLKKKTTYYNNILESNNNDWESTFYTGMAKYLSPNINRSLMEELSLRTPLKILWKHRDSLSHIEAILFGQSGLLNIKDELLDDYTNQLKVDYQFFQKKYGLRPMESTNWKFSKMRPLGFPTIRIAQLASFIFHSHQCFSQIVDRNNSIDKGEKFKALFNIEPSTYWKTHYQFGPPSKIIAKKIGESTIDSLIINVVVPLLFLHGITHDNQKTKDDSLEILTTLKAEKNGVITKWKSLGESPDSAYETQALLTLKKEYCDKKKCLQCDIGNVFMNHE